MVKISGLIIVVTMLFVFILNNCSHIEPLKLELKGFDDILMPSDVVDNCVFLYAPLNCPCEATQRAEELVEQLNKMGISTVRGQSFSVTLANATADDRLKGDRSQEILNGEGPAVFICGKGKSNPSIKEIISVYKLLNKTSNQP